jgi:exonuclease III
MLHPDQRIYTFLDYFRNAYDRDAGLRIDHHAPTWIELAETK